MFGGGKEINTSYQMNKKEKQQGELLDFKSLFQLHTFPCFEAKKCMINCVICFLYYYFLNY